MYSRKLAFEALLFTLIIFGCLAPGYVCQDTVNIQSVSVLCMLRFFVVVNIELHIGCSLCCCCVDSVAFMSPSVAVIELLCARSFVESSCAS